MKNNKSILIIGVLVVGLSSLVSCSMPDYKYLDYDQAIDKMRSLAREYPQFVKLHDAREENSHLGQVQCGHDM